MIARHIRFDTMRSQTHLVKSYSKVNIYWLAGNAGTSVDQLERFYLKHLAPSVATVRNIQSFRDD